MGIETMGQVIVKAKIENLGDLWEAQKGLIPVDKVRTIEVNDALVDTGATFVSLTPSLIAQLGLQLTGTRKAKTAAGYFSFNMYSAVRLTVQGRDCSIDVCEVPETCPVLIGVLPLEALDFVVDPKNQRLIGNPAHGGEHIIDML